MKIYKIISRNLKRFSSNSYKDYANELLNKKVSTVSEKDERKLQKIIKFENIKKYNKSYMDIENTFELISLQELRNMLNKKELFDRFYTKIIDGIKLELRKEGNAKIAYTGRLINTDLHAKSDLYNFYNPPAVKNIFNYK